MSRSELSLELPPDEAEARPAARCVGPFSTPARFSDGVDRPLKLSQLTPDDGLTGCLACGHPELYTQTDFPRALGMGIVVVAAVLAPFTNYISLAVAALVDAVIYRLAPEMVICYACDARHRGFTKQPRHPRFDRTIEERLRYGEKAVMGSPMRPGGTANAPEPEH